MSSFTGVRLNSTFAFKHIMNGESAVVFICGLWISLVVLTGQFLSCDEFALVIANKSTYLGEQ